MSYIKYGEKELNYLKSKDPILAKIINEVGFIKRTTDADLFASIISSIISQQISTKAAKTVYGRLQNKITITPKNIYNLTAEELTEIGISSRKKDYIINVAKDFLDNPGLYKDLHKQDDDAIIEVLTKLKGIGLWTAQMLLIHTFNRMDVISFLDLAIKKGLMKLYQKDILTTADEKYFKSLYSPYGTVASIYIWHYYAISS